MNNSTEVTTENWLGKEYEHGEIDIVDHCDGWARSGFNHRYTKLHFKRVNRDNQDLLQIDLEITEFKEKKTYSHLSGIELPMFEFEKVINHLNKNSNP